MGTPALKVSAFICQSTTTYEIETAPIPIFQVEKMKHRLRNTSHVWGARRVPARAESVRGRSSSNKVPGASPRLLSGLPVWPPLPCLAKAMASKLLRAVILGPPGSGKGTVCQRIAQSFGLQHLSSGHFLRENIKANTAW
ncbi:probable adenylate kinase 5, chloroplastic [Leptonychotes weddellii]|uniref:Probable adenylate kinase 5, chloroplastic n=1 Tax=Leptonychotes weddellii TaxID=9713 RepID=A0A7F8RY58_LEPWE|nr:probable adenylate kinase 5, chloroplastic [Leptonychotes weddellii]